MGVAFLLLHLLTSSLQVFPVDFAREDLIYLETGYIRMAELDENFRQAFPDNDDMQLLAKSVVYPELIRYSRIRNTAEVLANALQEESADFSIGMFQIKPSFVIRLSHHLSDKGIEHCLPDSSNALLFLIDTIDGSLLILRLFLDYMFISNPELLSYQLDEQIRLLATAHTFGHFGNLESIKQLTKLRTWFYMPYFKTPIFPYSEVSLYYYCRAVEKCGHSISKNRL